MTADEIGKLIECLSGLTTKEQIYILEILGVCTGLQVCLRRIADAYEYNIILHE